MNSSAERVHNMIWPVIGRMVFEGGPVVFELDETAVADGDPEDVESQVLERSPAIADRFAVNHPLMFPDSTADGIGEAGF
jgi:hypothetical protein